MTRSHEDGSFEDEVMQWHRRLFPEDYDFMHDSMSEAPDRRRGRDPMSAEHLEEVNLRRAGLGLAPHEPNGDRTEALAWIRQMLHDGESERLATLAAEIEGKAASAVLDAMTPKGSAEDRARDFDAYLAGAKLSSASDTPVEGLAIAIYGFLLSQSPADIHAEAADLFQERMPEIASAEAARLLKAAWDDWCDAYG